MTSIKATSPYKKLFNARPGEPSQVHNGLTYDYTDPEGGVWHDEAEYKLAVQQARYYSENFDPLEMTLARELATQIEQQIPSSLMEVFVRILHDAYQQQERLKKKAATLTPKGIQ